MKPYSWSPPKYFFVVERIPLGKKNCQEKVLGGIHLLSSKNLNKYAQPKLVLYLQLFVVCLLSVNCLYQISNSQLLASATLCEAVLMPAFILDFGGCFCCPILVPNFGTWIWCPFLGPNFTARFWDLILVPNYGTYFWDLTWNSILGSDLGAQFWLGLAWAELSNSSLINPVWIKSVF